MIRLSTSADERVAADLKTAILAHYETCRESCLRGVSRCGRSFVLLRSIQLGNNIDNDSKSYHIMGCSCVLGFH